MNSANVTMTAVPLVMIERDSVSLIDVLMIVCSVAPSASAEVLADAVGDDDGVVHREADDRQQAPRSSSGRTPCGRATGTPTVISTSCSSAIAAPDAEAQVEAERDVDAHDGRSTNRTASVASFQSSRPTLGPTDSVAEHVEAALAELGLEPGSGRVAAESSCPASPPRTRIWNSFPAADVLHDDLAQVGPRLERRADAR